jgi:hypothetical protein
MTTEAYQEITTEEFNRRLIEKLEDMTAWEFIQKAGDCLSYAQEIFNNEILEDYEEDNSHFLDYDTVVEMFTDGATFEEMRIKYKYDDIALREDFNNYTDMLCKDGQISDWAYHNWDNPF